MQTISEFDKQFGTDEDCKRFLTAMRWPDGVICPRCKSKDKVYALKARPFHWVCKSGLNSIDSLGQPVTCDNRNGYRFSVITHTIFQDTKVKLNIWFKVGFLMLTSKKGMSALQVHRVIFGEESTHDYHTTWFMCMRWRSAMAGDMYQPLTGVVEIDETYIGGKDRNRHKDKRSADMRRKAVRTSPFRKPGDAVGYGKVGVIGAIERKGNVVAKVIGSIDAPTLAGFARRATDEKVSLVMTDENPSYRNIGKGAHESVNHSQGEYVRGEIHTNNIESFWALLKRGVVGSYHNVSKKYLPFYLNEFSFRFNNRKNPDMFADLITTCAQ
jgi:IS1 family transposase